MRREEELRHPSQRLSDDEMLFRLRAIAGGNTSGTVESALAYAVADGALSGERASALRQALVDEGVIDDVHTVVEKQRAPRPGTANHSAEHPRLDRRCEKCGYGTNSRGHYVQCGGEK